MSSQQIQCPKCDSFKIRTAKSTGRVLIIVGLATFVFGIGIIFLLLGIVMSFQNQNTCETCGYKWKGNGIKTIVDDHNYGRMRECTGKLMAKDSYKKIQDHYSFMFKNSTRNYNSYIQSNVVKRKEWLAGNDGLVCDICKKNVEVGAIPLSSKFPSGHLYPPAGPMCRCSLQPVTK